MQSGQIIVTSHDLAPNGINGGLVREIFVFHWNLGWWNILFFSGQDASLIILP